MSPFLCSRHGVKSYTRASKAIHTRIKERGLFAADELAKVSVDRPKRSYTTWASRADIAPTIQLEEDASRTLHIKRLPDIPIFERTLAFVCPECLDELLVRSEREPRNPVSKEQAFDTAPIAATAIASDTCLRCKHHGFVFPTRSSYSISFAIDSNGVISARDVLQLSRHDKKHTSVYWFDTAFIHHTLNLDVDVPADRARLAESPLVDLLSRHGTRVCRRCLADLLQRSGIQSESAPGAMA